MLTHLHIRNFAIIDEIGLDFGTGMTALTGETGAGKSILLDALGLVLGDRADTHSVREGARRAEIVAEFDISGVGTVGEWLGEHDLDDDGACQLRRTVGADGRSRGYINGRPAPLSQMREVGERLVDIHGQHEHQSLRSHDAQRDLLDAFGEHHAEQRAVAEAYAAWREARQALEHLGGGAGTDRHERLDLLNYQIQELEALDLDAGEIADLDREHRRLAHAGRLLEACQHGLALLHEDEVSVHGLLSRVGSELGEVTEYDDAVGTAAELVDAAGIQVDEAVGTLRALADRVELDPQRLQWIEQRLQAIHDLARKHHVEPAGLADVLAQLQAERDGIEHADERAAELEAAIERARHDWREAAEALTAARQRSATALAEAVSGEMRELGMSGGRFAVELQPRDDERPNPAGAERVEFRVAANPGQSPGPLARIASGGELSRISLAIQMIGSRNAGLPTQIFDEVDAGIGGKVAAIVGGKLRALARQRQVLCVTHLPQVAARGHHHLRVAKHTARETVQTRLEPLVEEDRVEEVARMLGGERITDQSRAHAREMLAGEDAATGSD